MSETVQPFHTFVFLGTNVRLRISDEVWLQGANPAEVLRMCERMSSAMSAQKTKAKS